MSVIALTFASFLACDLSVPPDRSLDSADTGEMESDDASVDADGNPDISEDTGNTADTAGDSVADTGTQSSVPLDSCEASDLLFKVSLRSPEGEEISGNMSRNDAAKVWGVIENPCNNPVAYTTPNRCLVTGWSMTDSSMDEVATGTFPCLGRESTYTVDPESTLEQEVTPLHGLSAGTFKINVTWARGDTSYAMLDVAR